MIDQIEKTAAESVQGQTANLGTLLGGSPDQPGPATALDLANRLNERLAQNCEVFARYR